MRTVARHLPHVDCTIISIPCPFTPYTSFLYHVFCHFLLNFSVPRGDYAGQLLYSIVLTPSVDNRAFSS
jgi:hypothetical protein